MQTNRVGSIAGRGGGLLLRCDVFCRVVFFLLGGRVMSQAFGDFVVGGGERLLQVGA